MKNILTKLQEARKIVASTKMAAKGYNKFSINEDIIMNGLKKRSNLIWSSIVLCGGLLASLVGTKIGQLTITRGEPLSNYEIVLTATMLLPLLLIILT